MIYITTWRTDININSTPEGIIIGAGYLYFLCGINWFIASFAMVDKDMSVRHRLALSSFALFLWPLVLFWTLGARIEKCRLVWIKLRKLEESVGLDPRSRAVAQSLIAAGYDIKEHGPHYQTWTCSKNGAEVKVATTDDQEESNPGNSDGEGSPKMACTDSGGQERDGGSGG